MSLSTLDLAFVSAGVLGFRHGFDYDHIAAISDPGQLSKFLHRSGISRMGEGSPDARARNSMSAPRYSELAPTWWRKRSFVFGNRKELLLKSLHLVEISRHNGLSARQAIVIPTA